jgi:hypothetical protein
MGFKKGMGLGSDSSGITTPLPVKLKSGAYIRHTVALTLIVDRSGLGKVEEEARKEEEKVTKALRAEKTSLSTFKARVANKFQEKRQEEQYKKVELDPSARALSHCLFFQCASTAHQLDCKNGVQNGPYAPLPPPVEGEPIKEVEPAQVRIVRWLLLQLRCSYVGCRRSPCLFVWATCWPTCVSCINIASTAELALGTRRTCASAAQDQARPTMRTRRCLTMTSCDRRPIAPLRSGRSRQLPPK